MTIFLVAVLFSANIAAQGIRGTIIDDEGIPVPGATIFFKETSMGTTSNVEGFYEINLTEGSYTISFQSLGYARQDFRIKITDKWLELDITLYPVQYRLNEVNIYSGEDPAYPIMRKAIGRAPYFLRQVKNYEAEVYLKGSLTVKNIPRPFREKIAVNDISIKPGENYTSESVNNIRFSAPDTVLHTVIASRNSLPGADESAVFGYINASLYDADNELIVSPLSPQAMRHYRFRYEGFFDDGKYTVNKIKVTPRRKNQQLLEGYIYIVEGLWNLHSVDLSTEPFFGKIRLRQQYNEIKEDVWLPVSHIFNIDAGLIGFKGDFDYTGTVKYLSVNVGIPAEASIVKADDPTQETEADEAEHSPQPEPSKNQKKIEELLSKDDLTNRDMTKLAGLIEKESKSRKDDIVLEVKNTYHLEVQKDSAKRDSLFWNTIRPIPLTENETEGFVERGDNKSVSHSGTSISLGKSSGKFGQITGKIFTGGNFSRDSSNVRFSYGGLISPEELGFNPVDGWRYGQNFGIRWTQDSTHIFNFRTNAGYAFASDAFYGGFRVSQTYSPLKRGSVSLSGNIGTKDFNTVPDVLPIVYMASSLLLKDNHTRYFDNKDIMLANSIDIANGFRMNASVAYQWATPLENNTNFSIFRHKKDYAPNTITNNPAVNESHFAKQESFIAKLSFDYTPRQRYYIRRGRKRMLDSDFPTFTWGIEQGIKAFSSNADYLLINAGVYQKHDFSFRPVFSWDLYTGWFIRNKQMHFSNFSHLNATQIPLLTQDFGNRFFLVDNYEASTNKWYIKANGTYSSPFLMLKYLPGISNTLWNENLHVGYLHTPDFPHYVQLGYSISRILVAGNLGVFAGFSEGKYRHWGVRIAIAIY